jgi:hypothetical protein
MSDKGLSLENLMRARDILDAQSIPVPDMYFDHRTCEWFMRVGDKWEAIPEIQPGLLPAEPHRQGD